MKQYKRGITFGAFDPLHIGHINLFRNAKKQCEYLIVCVSNAGYIRKTKGHGERFSFLERTDALDEISLVDETDFQGLQYGKKEAIERHKPDVIFVGDDWTPETFSGEGLGVPVVYLPRTQGVSSTQLSERV